MIIIGYPYYITKSNEPNKQFRAHSQMCSSEGQIEEVEVKENDKDHSIVKYKIDTCKGQSGSSLQI